MSGQNKAIARRWVDELLNPKNMDVLDKIYAPDYVDHDPTMPEDLHGPEGAKEVYDTYLAGITISRIEGAP